MQHTEVAAAESAAGVFPEKEVGVKRTIVFIITALLLAISMAGPATAKIEPVDTRCSTAGGPQVDSKTTCPGGNGLTQEWENQNPHGFAPPGQNK
jgi:hypothetical protein